MRFTATAFTAALLAGSAQALFGKKPPAVKPHLVEGFQWKNPYAEDNTVEGFTAACEHIQSFPGKQYTLNDLVEHFPDGLRPWSTGLKKFFTGKEYPGSWSGYDRHGLDRALVLLDYDTVPLAVREWIEESQRSGAKEHALFAVFDKVEDEETILEDIIHFPSTSEVDRSKDSDKVVIFAPGALYHVLPLWVAADSQCQGKQCHVRGLSVRG